MVSESVTLAPHPRSSPNVMLPRQSGLTRSPERPSVMKELSDISISWDVKNGGAAIRRFLFHRTIPETPGGRLKLPASCIILPKCAVSCIRPIACERGKLEIRCPSHEGIKGADRPPCGGAASTPAPPHHHGCGVESADAAFRVYG